MSLSPSCLRSTGCGENGCTLCQYNPSRLCKRNLKNKYLIDDHLRAKCGAPLRVELVDESGACESEGLPQGTQLEVSTLPAGSGSYYLSTRLLAPEKHSSRSLA